MRWYGLATETSRTSWPEGIAGPDGEWPCRLPSGAGRLPDMATEALNEGVLQACGLRRQRSR